VQRRTLVLRLTLFFATLDLLQRVTCACTMPDPSLGALHQMSHFFQFVCLHPSPVLSSFPVLVQSTATFLTLWALQSSPFCHFPPFLNFQTPLHRAQAEETIALDGEEDTPIEVNDQDMKPPAKLKGGSKIKVEGSMEGVAKQTHRNSAGGKAVRQPLSKEESIKLDSQQKRWAEDQKETSELRARQAERDNQERTNPNADQMEREGQEQPRWSSVREG
jgi:hypothetical protein